jgi:predicted  nucleic acid-binding Zn-ribbon protein
VREFCTPQRGYQRGSQGVHYLGVCPPDLEPAFLEAYQLGQTVYRLEKEIKDSKRSLKSLYDEVDSIEQTIVDLKHELVHEGHNPRKRRQLLRDIRIQEDQKAELLDQINAQENQLDALNRKLARLEGNRP